MASLRNEGTRILVLDDDPEIRELLKDYLAQNGFDVIAVGDSTALDRALVTRTFDLLVLDLMLPGEDGFAIAKRLKKTNNMPIVMLSARRETNVRIDGLELGADDYIVKPFHPAELVARLRAVLRRSSSAARGSDIHVYKFGDYVLDTKTHTITKKEQEVFLTTAEFDLLTLFAREPYRVMDRDLIHLRLTGAIRDKADRTVDVRITRLRSKIETDPASPQFVKTVWRKGYVFCPSAVDEFDANAMVGANTP